MYKYIYLYILEKHEIFFFILFYFFLFLQSLTSLAFPQRLSFAKNGTYERAPYGQRIQIPHSTIYLHISKSPHTCPITSGQKTICVVQKFPIRCPRGGTVSCWRENKAGKKN